MALKDKEAFYGRLSRRMEKQYLADTDSLKKEYENLAQRNQEIAFLMTATGLMASTGLSDEKAVTFTVCFGEIVTSAKDISFPEDSAVDVSVI